MDLPPPPQIKFDVPNLAEAWKKWEKSYDVYRVAKELHKKMDDAQIVMWLYIAGPEAQGIFETFQFGDEESPEDYKDVVRKFPWIYRTSAERIIWKVTFLEKG